MNPFAAFFVLSVSFWSAAGVCKLPPAVIEVIETQKPRFQQILKTSTSTQAKLILERYADLLLASPFTLELKIDRAELIAHLSEAFLLDKRKHEKQQPKYSESIDKELTQLAGAFQGKFRDGLLHLKVRCDEQIYRLPFKIEAAGPIAFEMTLEGVPVPEANAKLPLNNICLRLFFVAKKLPATLDTINTANVACALPPKRAGTCLLNIAEQIVAATGRDRIKLTDGSKIQCASNRQPTSLWHLRVYQGRPTWYEGRGYRAVETMREKREVALKAAITYTLKDLVADLNRPKEIPMERAEEATELLKTLAPKFDDSGKNTTVAQFMSWLWEKDCAAYVLIDELITSPIRGFEYGALFPLVNEFEKKLR